MAEHNELGKQGEEIATKYLRSKGFVVLERNWRFGRDEVDIIANDNACLVIIEVKTRSSAAFGEPEIFVTRQKQKFLIRATNVYINWKNIDIETRFDIVAITITNGKAKVKHIRDAFYPTL